MNFQFFKTLALFLESILLALSSLSARSMDYGLGDMRLPEGQNFSAGVRCASTDDPLGLSANQIAYGDVWRRARKSDLRFFLVGEEQGSAAEAVEPCSQTYGMVSEM